MTLGAAYRRLQQRWPDRSFLIQLDCWHFVHKDIRTQPQLSWRIYDADAHESWTGPTLDHAMELALGCDADLSTVEAQIADLAP